MDIHKFPGVLPGKEHAFMLRIWMEDLGEGQLDLRGRIQHINSGEALYFRDWKVLICFMQSMVLGQAEEKKTQPQGGGGDG